MTKRECPVCADPANRRVLHKQTFVAGGVLGRGYDVVVCDNCGAGFADGIPGQKELDLYYAEQSKYEFTQSGGTESLFDLQRFTTIFEQVSSYRQDRAAEILDVGCATGGLLALFKKKGYTRLTGIDPSSSCVEAARRLYGLEANVGTLATLVSSKRRFDIIMLVGVLEHLYDLHGALRNVASLLKDGGLIYCAQPDVEQFTEVLQAPFQQFSTEHINFFSRQSLRRAMAQIQLVEMKSWRWIVEWREGAKDSVLSAVYIPGNPPDLDPDSSTEPSLGKYIKESEAGESKLVARVNSLVALKTPLIIWGTGTHTRRLLANTRLGEACITAFVDSNVHQQGQKILGIPIIAPQQIRPGLDPIFIGSQVFENEIREEIRKLRLPNPIISFHRPGSS